MSRAFPLSLDLYTMGETKREPSQQPLSGTGYSSGVSTAISDVVGVGGVGGVSAAERETTPAPPNAQDLDEIRDDRPTPVPAYDVRAIAWQTALRAPPSLPVDVVIPARTRVTPPADLALRSAFVLLHVDGRSSVRDIAERTELPVDEVMACVLQLTAAGLLELGTADGPGATPHVGAAPQSGDRRKDDAPPDSR